MATTTMRPRCYYCHRFISSQTVLRNWKLIQAPGVADPEPYEIVWCDGCGHDGERAAERYHETRISRGDFG